MLVTLNQNNSLINHFVAELRNVEIQRPHEVS